jgi:thymidylate synthase
MDDSLGYRENWEWDSIDQIANLINDLKTNPDSRRLMVNVWNVGELDQMVLPPCHYGFQVYTRELSWEERRDIAEVTMDKREFSGYFNEEKGYWVGFGHISPFTDWAIHAWLNSKNIPTRAISLMWNQRSVDTFLGLPFNIASYGLLLEMLAKEVNMVPDQLIGNLGDVHLYSNHIEQAKEQIGREGFDLPIVKLSSGHNLRAAIKGNFEEIDPNDIMLINYQSHPTIKAPLSN